jgi:hypothetical protein
MGDGKSHTAFKRANVAKEVGEKAIAELVEIGIIKEKKSKTSSSKLYFTSPFLRFWFAFVSPLFKGVRDGNYQEVKERFTNREGEFTALTFKQLSWDVLKKSHTEDPIKKIGEYWENNIEFDILATTASKKTIVGLTKFTNSKLKKSDFTKLQEDAKKANLEVDTFILFSKAGFSSELKALKGEALKLFTPKNFKILVE